jgi:hypothetical protein
MLHMFYLDVAKVDMGLHVLRWLYICVASVCLKCFSCFKRVLQVFHLDVAYITVAIHVVASVFSKCFQLFHLDIAYIAVAIQYVASICSKCFTYFRCLLQAFYQCCICYSGYTHML